MKRLSKKILIIVSIILLTMIMLIGESKASLQANPNTHNKKSDTIDNWMINIRNMEKSGESMGLDETLNEDLTPSSTSNNIDVHFMRSTEYGAIAILSASGYGNSKTLQESEIKTTTGNKTGIYFSGANWEWTSGGYGNIPSGANERYYDTYINKDNTSARIGDALGTATTPNPGCAGWHKASFATWGGVNNVYFLRGNGGLFSFGNIHGDSYYYIKYACGRAAVANGEGL